MMWVLFPNMTHDPESRLTMNEPMEDFEFFLLCSVYRTPMRQINSFIGNFGRHMSANNVFYIYKYIWT